MKTTLPFIFLLLSQLLSAQDFTESVQVPAIEGVEYGSISFADVDGDNDEDFLVTGRSSNSGFTIAKLFMNDGMGNFTEMLGTPFFGVRDGDAAFADVDGDDDLDVLITGTNMQTVEITKLYLNDGVGNFTELTGLPFVNLSLSTVSFADIDGDDDQDVLITGNDGNSRLTKLYTNDGSANFSEVIDAPFDGIRSGSTAFADIDNDNDVDLLITGLSNNSGRIAKLYRNDGLGNFTEIENTPFDEVDESAVAFADVDGDMDLDLLITGSRLTSLNSPTTKLYTNDGSGTFTEVIDMPFDDILQGAVAFADVDGDSDPDLLITGRDDVNVLFVKLYNNDGMGTFSEVMDTPFEAVKHSSVAFSDIDSDSDQDVLIIGRNTDGDRTTKIYLNNSMTTSIESVSERLDFEFTLYPNPTKADQVKVTYQSTNEGPLKVTIFDLNGSEVIQKELPFSIRQETFLIDINTLSKGTYVFELLDGKKKGVRQFMVE